MTIDYSALTVEQLENMTDEEFNKLDPTQFVEPTAPVVEETPAVVEEVATPAVEVPVVETPTAPTVIEGEPNVATPNGDASVAEQTQAGDGVVEGKPEVKVEEIPITAEKAFFDRVTSEFNANGKAFKIDNADDVVSLMQKGLNYNQKMATLKPSMKLVKALQEQNINSVEDLGYLLDLKNKNPAAIAKLLQESGLDTYDLNEDKANTYVPSVPQVSDATINFEMAASALEGNPHFTTAVQHISTFDDHSKNEVFNNPHLLGLLTDHVQHGYYDKIVARVEQEQAVGRLSGMSFLQAYDTVGNAMFGQQAPQTPVQQVQQPAVIPQAAVPVPVAQKVNPSNNAARQAAASTTSTAATVQKTTYTPEELWNMSDEDFKKIDPKFL